jgi:hypothetical protein
MRIKSFIYILFLSIIFSCNCSNKIIKTSKLYKNTSSYVSDSLYNNEELLNKFAEILNELLETHRDRIQTVCRVENAVPKFFFVYDLVDTMNNTIDNDRIAFINKHIYHFSTISMAFSYSNICIINDTDIVIFRNINCSSSEDTIEKVLDYVNNMLIPDKKYIIDRVKNYRKYSYFIKTDNHTRPPDGCK